MKLDLELDASRVRPGEVVTGRVRALEGGEAHPLTLTVGFYERTRDYVMPAASESRMLHEGPVAPGDVYEFSFTVPDDALPTTKGANGELFWAVAAQAGERGLDATAERRFEVV